MDTTTKAARTEGPCKTCKDPGHCCKRLMLGGVTEAEFPTIEDARAIAAAWPFEPNGLPFLPMRVVQGHWLFTCPRLDWATGLCRDYDSRPKLCREYEPLSDPLCAMYVPPSAAEVRDNG